jgi:hypothetical protein
VRWEWEAAAARKAARARAKAEQWADRNGAEHGYTVSGVQKRRRVLVQVDDVEDGRTANKGIGWGPAYEGAVMTTRDAQHEATHSKIPGNRRRKPLWERPANEAQGDNDGDETIEAMVDYSSDGNYGDSDGEWELLDQIPHPRQTFEVVIHLPPRTSTSTPARNSATAGSLQPPAPAPGSARGAKSPSPLFFETDSEDGEYTDNDAEASQIQKSSPALCFSPLALSAGPTPRPREPTEEQDKQNQKTQDRQSFTPLTLLPSTPPLQMPTRPRPASTSASSPPPPGGWHGSGDGGVRPDPITPKQPPRSLFSSPHSAEKSFVSSPGFFGTFERQRQEMMRGSLEWRSPHIARVQVTSDSQLG